eukprot:TRINITY_DN5371_c0_g2_i1.p1 TRINITY_DN5371_c0_g2~~TRINITY_DN5371_c0_g2_i1.p1  ORF type:complete len:898 (-),score=253.27 TRINITY_DN5371_c0_g2_i1:47-2386(-)
MAVVAIKGAELCRHLGPGAVMFRECQEHESQQFMSIFPFGVKYLDGGIASALRSGVNEDDDTDPKLFQIKGRRKVRVCQVELVPSSLNSGDVFIIDTPDAIYQWSGKEANRFEKAKALEFCLSLKEKKKKRVPIVVMDEHDEEPEFLELLGVPKGEKFVAKSAEHGGLDEAAEVNAILNLYQVVESGPDAIYQWSGKEANRFEKAKALEFCLSLKEKKKKRVPIVVMDEHDEEPEFLELLGVPKGEKFVAKSAEHGGLDEAAEVNAILNLYQVVESGEFVELKLVPKDSDGFLSRSMLRSSEVFVLDCETEVFVWIGKHSSKTAKAEAMRLAVVSLNFLNRPAWIPISRMMESGETSVFQQKFRDWHDQEIKEMFKKRGEQRRRQSEIAKPQFTVNCSALHKKTEKKDNIVDTVKEGVLLYEVVETDLEDVPQEKYGYFSQKSSYVIVFSANEVAAAFDEAAEEKGVSDMVTRQYVMYWQGRECSKVSVLTWKMELAREICDMLESGSGQTPVTLTVFQGREPDFFFSIFDQEIVIFREKEDSVKPKQLFHVKSTQSMRSITVEVDPTINSLNPGDAFVLRTFEKIYCWAGPYCDLIEKETCLAIADRLKGDKHEVVDITEDAADDPQFWKLLGGTFDQIKADNARVDHTDYHYNPRLFQCSDASGTFKVEEIYNFSQDDLISDDVMMLDVKTEIYLWIGNSSRKEEKQMSLQVAQQYIASAPDGRPADCPVIEIPEGNESWMFTRHFHGWRQKKQFVDPYQKNMDKLREMGLLGKVIN